jgi:hypothetical protein
MVEGIGDQHQGDGKIVVVGGTNWRGFGALALARFNNRPPDVTLQFEPPRVRPGSSFTATFSGKTFGVSTYFDVRYRSPAGGEAVALNWQHGIKVGHTVPAGTCEGIWTITGIRPHEEADSHSGDFTPSLVTLTVAP